MREKYSPPLAKLNSQDEQCARSSWNVWGFNSVHLRILYNPKELKSQGEH